MPTVDLRRSRNLVLLSRLFMRDPQQPRWGMDLIRETGKSTNAIYPTLGRMLDAGWLASCWEDPKIGIRAKRPSRRYYVPTDLGRKQMREMLG